MSQLIELIGSTVIAGYIILIILALNLRLSNSQTQYLQHTFNQRNSLTTAIILEADFNKIGYKAKTNKILQADSAAIKYLTDYNNKGVKDTISFYLGDGSKVQHTSNPNDKLLYRRRNQIIQMSGIVTRFNLQYFDSLLNKLSYSSLTNPLNLAKIRVIRAYVKTELPDLVDQSYNPIEWRKDFRPKNIQ